MAASDKTKILVLCGPTAVGKTALGIRLAQRLNGEIISADSMQIYKGLDIGTAKPTVQERAQAAHHLIDFLPPQCRYSAADYTRDAAQSIIDISARGKLPILVGGTGLYIDSLVKGIRFIKAETDFALREKLNKQAETQGVEPLLEQLRQIDPQQAQEIDVNNTKRVVRALELALQTGQTAQQRLQASLPEQEPYDAKVVVLHCPQREALYRRIDLRVDQMLQQGLLQEARQVYQHRDEYITAAQAIGYKEFFAYFENKATLEECSAALKQASRRYAKRQLTWFRHIPQAVWLDAEAADNEEKIIALLNG